MRAMLLREHDDDFAAVRGPAEAAELARASPTAGCSTSASMTLAAIERDTPMPARPPPASRGACQVLRRAGPTTTHCRRCSPSWQTFQHDAGRTRRCGRRGRQASRLAERWQPTPPTCSASPSYGQAWMRSTSRRVAVPAGEELSTGPGRARPRAVRAGDQPLPGYVWGWAGMGVCLLEMKPLTPRPSERSPGQSSWARMTSPPGRRWVPPACS